jgi:hypothetical protein
MTIRTYSDIKATPEQVRAVFFDFEKFNQWSTALPSISNATSGVTEKSAVGDTIKVFVSFLGQEIKPIVTSNNEKGFSWDGKLLFNFLFYGHHYFEFEQLDETTTRFYHGEDFSGVIFSVYKAFKGLQNMIDFYQLFADELKTRVEELYPQK